MQTDLKFINFQGLNCFHNSVATLVASIGKDYNFLFSGLWGETRLIYDEKSELYISRRFNTNLSHLNLYVDELLINHIDKLEENSFFIVAFDSFDVFWNTTYKTRHGLHYFIAQKSSECDYMAYDPTLNKAEIKLDYSEMKKYAKFIFILKKKLSRPYKKISLGYQVKQAKSVLPRLNNLIQTRLKKANSEKEYILLAKYCDTLANNRYMFRHMIQDKYHLECDLRHFMPNNYFLTFTAIKNGLFRLSVLKDEKTKKQIANLIETVLENEVKYADVLLSQCGL